MIGTDAQLGPPVPFATGSPAITVTNSSADEAEWSVTPVVSHDGVSAIGDYVWSTHLPGDIDAGQTVAGWLFVPVDPAGLGPGTLLHVRFPNVAANGYHTVGHIDLDAEVSSST